MATERTLSIIKPDAVKAGHAGAILAMFEKAGFNIVAQKRITLTKAQSEAFYIVHKDRPFYGELTQFMATGPCIVQVLEKENAIAANRELMGATNFKDAKDGTIRKLYATSIQDNAVHGSDAPDTAEWEIGFFFSRRELLQAQGK